MKRIFSLLAVTTALSVSVALPSLAESVQGTTNTSASAQVEANRDAGFFNSIDNSVRGWFSADNDRSGRMEMAQNPAYTGQSRLNSTAEVDGNAGLNRTAPSAGADSSSATGTSTTSSGASASTGVRANIDTDVSSGVSAGTGVGVDANVGGGTTAGMGAAGSTSLGAGVAGSAGGSAGTR